MDSTQPCMCTSMPGQNGSHFTYGILKRSFGTKVFFVFSLKFHCFFLISFQLSMIQHWQQTTIWTNAEKEVWHLMGWLRQSESWWRIPSDVYNQWTGFSLIRVTNCHMFGAKPPPESAECKIVGHVSTGPYKTNFSEISYKSSKIRMSLKWHWFCSGRNLLRDIYFTVLEVRHRAARYPLEHPLIKLERRKHIYPIIKRDLGFENMIDIKCKPDPVRSNDQAGSYLLR